MIKHFMSKNIEIRETRTNFDVKICVLNFHLLVISF
jgi:hypothetical protein